MDLQVREDLQNTIDSLTHSGEPSLNEKLLKKIKQHCKTNDLYLNVAFEKLMKDLKTKHSEVRLSSFQIIDELFQRSHSFRTLVCSNCKEIIHLVCGIDPLPLPKSVADTLQKTSLLSFKKWVEKYGDGYPKLKLGYTYLQRDKKVDLDGLVAATQGELRRQEEREDRQKAFLEQRLEKIKEEMSEQTLDIRGCLIEMESCFQILVPSFEMNLETTGIGMRPDTTGIGMRPDTTGIGMRPENGTGMRPEIRTGMRPDTTGTGMRPDTTGTGMRPDTTGTGMRPEFGTGMRPDTTGTGMRPVEECSTDSDDSDTEWDEVIQPTTGASINGLFGGGRNVAIATITVPDRVQVIADNNETLIETLKERYKQLNKTYIPKINKWIQWFTKAGQEKLLKEAIDLKGQTEAIKNKYNQLLIIGLQEEEEKEEPSEPQKTPAVINNVTTVQGSVPWTSSYYLKPSLTAVAIENDLANDPTTVQAQMKVKGLLDTSSDSNQTSLDREKTSMKAAVPFGADLIHWGKSDGVSTDYVPTRMDSLHGYWCQEPDLNISEDYKATLQYRHITFAGQFEPVTRACNAPLPSGTLCPRKDRYKCPLHGLIIPRDESGQPLEEKEDTQATSGSNTLCTANSGDTAAGLPIEGKKSEKKRKGKTKNYPGLTDIKKSLDTPKNRLETKILNKRVMSKVGRKMDSLSKRKAAGKFADNFNYALRS